MTEKEFLEKRMPFWLVDDDLKILFPTNADKIDMHAKLSRKYNFNWLYCIRGYYWPGSHVQIYQGDYDAPNCTLLVAQYLLQYFPDANYIGFGCNKGKIGEIWEPKYIVPRNIGMLKDEVLNI